MYKNIVYYSKRYIIMIERKQYLDKLIALKDKQLIKVITGIRRCGKSTLFKLYQDYLLKNGISKEQIQMINFEDIINEDLQDYKKLYKHILDNSVKDKKNYIFLDEIQNVPQFQKTVDSLYIKDNFDIYITGSNAYLLSGELATLLSGRYIEIQMLPLSFKEYISSFEGNTNTQQLFAKYLENGSFPYILQIQNELNVKKDYLKAILDSILIKDVIARNKISNVDELHRILRFMFDNIGNICSIKKISDTMTSAGFKIVPKTVEKYITSLIESFVLYSVSRYDIKGKQYLQSGEKYYIADTGLRNTLLNKNSDVGRLIENTVYLELIRRGYQVFIGKTNTTEVDFVANKDNETVYFQVAQTILAEDILNRELKPLQNIKDNYPKYLLTLDYLPQTDYNGIKQINIIDWLLDK